MIFPSLRAGPLRVLILKSTPPFTAGVVFFISRIGPRGFGPVFAPPALFFFSQHFPHPPTALLTVFREDLSLKV